MDCFEKFNERQLPKIKYFYSSLTMESISKENYEFAKKVWNEFEFETLGEYHDFYCLLDTALLADIFQKFRKSIKNVYGLEACNYYSIPGLAFSAALKYTKVKLEFIKDIDIYQFIEKSIRGGVCGVMQRISTANNPFIANYDSKAENKYLCHFDG